MSAQNSNGDNNHRRPQRSHRTVALVCVSAALGMGALSFAAVPLYRMFCQVTGFGGTTQRAEKAPDRVLDRKVTVRFDANVEPGLPWQFEPAQRTVDVKLGESMLAFYRATNNSSEPITGTASFNVSPDIAGKYFAKIECFCFKEQTLQPGESVEMPVSFFVDPAMIEDVEGNLVHEITLSYRFYRTAKGGAAAVAQGPPGQGS